MNQPNLPNNTDDLEKILWQLNPQQVDMTIEQAVAEITKHHQLQAYREVMKARIDENNRHLTFKLNAFASDDYKAGFRDAVSQVDKDGERRQAELNQLREAAGELYGIKET